LKKKNIYVDVRHSNYWWGIYNFDKPTSWEDLIIYEKKGKGFRKLAWTCICSSSYLRSGLNDLKSDEEEKKFVDKIEQFLKDNETVYHYCYDKPEDDDFYEVPYEAEKNSFSIKPRSIETWYPCEGIDKKVIDKVAIEFCRKFLDIEVGSVNYKETISKEDALESYIEFTVQMQGFTGIKFSDELIECAKKEWSVPEEKVIEILNRSLK